MVYQNSMYNPPSNLFSELMLPSKIVFKSMTDPEDPGQVDLQAQMG